MSTSKYFVRVAKSEEQKFLDHIESKNIVAEHISTDFASNGLTNIYKIIMDGEEALSLKLSLQVAGIVKLD